MGLTNIRIVCTIHIVWPTSRISSALTLLFKQHPEAISARNLLKCTVANTFAADNRIGAELVCGEKRWLPNDETSCYGAGGHGGVRTFS